MSIYGRNSIRLALVRPLPSTFAKALMQHAPAVPIDPDLAQRQHEAYVDLLRARLPEVVTVPVDESHPDCCFIEDTAIAVGGTVIISRIGAPSRRDESRAVATAFHKLQQAGRPLKIRELEAPATLDGGDVLQMGRHVFVGLSQRTNAAAVEQLQELLPDRIVIAVPVSDGLHLKSVLSAGDDKTLIAAEDAAARPMVEAIMKALPQDARCLRVPDTIAANVLRLGSAILVQDGFPKSRSILQNWVDEWKGELIALNMSEMIKADGALTCCSILLAYE